MTTRSIGAGEGLFHKLRRARDTSITSRRPKDLRTSSTPATLDYGSLPYIIHLMPPSMSLTKPSSDIDILKTSFLVASIVQ
jgi:hypothetical protein